VPRTAPPRPPGTAVTVGIRPEDLMIADVGLPATLSHIEDLGAQKLLYLSVGGRDVIAMGSPRTHVQRGASLHLGLREDALSLFPAV
jgi:ABC-type sugar transport system ATPase subunit